MTFRGGIEVEFLEALRKYFNFNYDVINCMDNWGTFQNGSWTGIVGQVFYQVIFAVIQFLSGSYQCFYEFSYVQRAHLGIGGVSFTYERSQAIQYSKVYLFSPLTYITPPPGTKPPVTLILEPFDVPVWISVLFALLFVIIAQRIIIHKVIKNRKSDITWPLISCLLRQGKSLLLFKCRLNVLLFDCLLVVRKSFCLSNVV